MKRRLFFGFLLVLALVLVIGGCGQKEPAEPVEPAVDPAENAAVEQVDAPETLTEGEEATSSPNIFFNKDKKEVSVFAEVNGKYFTEPTRHGVVYAGGSNGDKSVLRGLGDEKVFYETMVAVGFEPSNTMTIDDMSKGVKIEGEALDVFVSWDGQEIPFADIITASEERPMDVRFGGNIANANEYNTGCILCLDSCAVGITSNAAYETGASNDIQFYGNCDVLPADGTKVKVTFRARE